jgi:hypothetical protein
MVSESDTYVSMEIDDDNKSASMSISSQYDEEEQAVCCGICLCPFEADDPIGKSNNLDCHHLYHQHCIRDWLIHNELCPFCRKPFLSAKTDASAAVVKQV